MKLYSHTETPVLQHNRHLYALSTESFSIEVDPIDRESFQAMAEVASFGALTVARVDSGAAVVKRHNEVEPDPAFRRFTIMFVIDGSLNISHHLGMSSLKAGEFVMMDNSHPRTMFVYNQVSLLLISVSRQVLQRYIPVPEEVEALVLDRDVCREDPPLFSPVLVLWEHMKKGALREFAPDISDELLSSIAKAFVAQCQKQGSIRSRRIAQARHYIEAQLNNPTLNIESIADGLGISTRYLRFLFKDTEKPSHYILRRRLEESANQLANILNRNSTIADIAFRCGFNSTAHFSRSFRDRYGVPPRLYRRKYLMD
jgi:AraC family transcriptional regulator, positive regulator of tynA and feaB